jgi:DNA helicase-2/ATP-dependent DNA helicase PcrA
MDYQSFVDNDKSLLIAPAGYGKTFTIVESLKYTTGKQLILTHTHAGIASIKDKLKEANVKSELYKVETISGFFQRYYHAFYSEITHSDEVQSSSEYHSFILNKAKELFTSSIIKTVINSSYNGLFVDEYQDCTIKQHTVIMELSKVLPTRILGDPLQGIFEFGEPLVNFDRDLSEFVKFPELATPFRWYKEGNNKALGDLIKSFRKPLLNGDSIDVKMQAQSGFYVIQVKGDDINDPRSFYREKLIGLISNKKANPDFDNLLIITPEYTEVVNGKSIKRGGVADRASILSKVDYSHSITPIEAIDEKTFYKLASDIDGCINSLKSSKKPIKKIYDIFCKLFNKSSPKKSKNVGLNDWFHIPSKSDNKDYGIKRKIGNNKITAERFIKHIDNFTKDPNVMTMYKLFMFIKSDLKLKKTRRIELLYSILKSLKESSLDNSSVLTAMVEHKNIIRRVGRRADGKCIGTTLLTKGLEFDTVAILDAHKFECPKHLYVALTRCCKNLIIFTASETLLNRIK